MMKYLILLLSLFLFNSSVWAQNNVVCNEAQKLNLIEGKDGWLFRTKTDFQSDFTINNELQKKIKQLNDAFEKHDIQLVIALLPTRGMVHHKYDANNYNPDTAINSYNKLVEELEIQGLHIASIDNLKNLENFYYKQDHHWSAQGAREMARNVAEKIKNLSVYKELNKSSFKTDSVDKVISPRSFNKLIEKSCGKINFDENIEVYKTYSLDSDLFSENEEPQIVLLGTSNSDQEASKANFEGFLKEYLLTNIANYSISGGGFDSSMLQYLSSERYTKNKPKVIIWEFPVYQNFRNINFYKQAIPAVFGGCGGKQIYSNEIVIKENKFLLLLDKPVQASKIYMELNITGFAKRKIRITVNYDDGEREAFDFERSKFYEMDGKFFLELNNGKNIKSIEGLLPDGEYNDNKIKLCRY